MNQRTDAFSFEGGGEGIALGGGDDEQMPHRLRPIGDNRQGELRAVRQSSQIVFGAGLAVSIPVGQHV